MYKALVIGENGYISHFLKNKYNSIFKFTSERLGTINLHNLIKKLKPKYLIIMGGLVSFKLIKNNRQKAFQINVIDTIKTVDFCKEINVIPIFISSESVFDGSIGFYSEDYEPSPIFFYGEMKNTVEMHIKNNLEKYFIVRFSKVYSVNCKDNTLLFSFFKKENSMREKMKLSYDSCFSPVSIEYVCNALTKIIQDSNCSSKIFHLSGVEFYSRSELADLYNSIQKNNNLKIEYISCRHQDIDLVSHQPRKTNMLSNITRRSLEIAPDILSENFYKIIKNYS